MRIASAIRGSRGILVSNDPNGIGSICFEKADEELWTQACRNEIHYGAKELTGLEASE
jgi:hypothetical protein